MKFTEEKLEQAIIGLLEQQGYPYHPGEPLAQLRTLNMAAEFVRMTEKMEKRYMALVSMDFYPTAVSPLVLVNSADP